jgi:glutamate-1-semialdehyde 2,1-aminomutase
MESVLEAEISMTVAGTFSGNPMTLAAGTAMLKHLHANPQIYENLARKGDRLRNGFNDWAKSKGYPAFMTGVASMFQIHLKDTPINQPRDLIGQLSDPLSDLQLYLRLNGVFIPWLHLAFISDAHSDEVIEEIIRVHQVSVEACLKDHQLI